MYRCDPALNTACKKTLCRSECLLTAHKEYRADYEVLSMLERYFKEDKNNEKS